MKNKQLYFLGIIAIIIILCVGLILVMIRNHQLLISDKSTLPPLDFTKFNQGQIIEAVINPQNSNLTDIYLGYKIDGSKLIGTYKNVMPGIYSIGDRIAGNIYIIKDNELWLKSKDDKEIKLFIGQIYKIKVSPDEHYIAIDVAGNYLVMLNGLTGEKITYQHNDLSFDEIGEVIEPVGWTNDGKYFWGGTPSASTPDFFRISMETKISEKFSPLKFSIYSNDYSVNVNTGILAYSLNPKVPAGEAPNIQNKISVIELYAYNFFNKKEIKITESYAKIFNPIWIDDITVQYDNPLKSPVGQNKISYAIPADLYYNQQTKQKLMSQIEDWNLYQEVTDLQEKNIACDCSVNKEYNDLNVKIKEGSAKRLMLNNALPLLITPNYFNWSNDKFLSFNNDSTAICCAGSTYPIKAYKDRLLWANSCSGGAAAPTIECSVAEEVLEGF